MPAQDVLVIGLGYVGLPLAVRAALAGFRVTGYDTSAEIAAGLNWGRSHVDDVSGPEVGAAYKFLLELRLENGPMEHDAALTALKEWWTGQG